MKNVLKKAFACILTFAMIVGCVSVASAVSVDATELTVGIPAECVTNKTEWFTFTVSEAGRYNIYSDSEYDLVGTLYDSSMTMIGYNDDHFFEAGDFYMEADLEAGSTYYLKVDSYTEKIDISYFVCVALVPPAESIQIDYYKNWGFVGETVDFYAWFFPEESLEEYCTWSVADESIAYIEEPNYSVCSLIFTAPGSTVLTCITDSGLEASVEIEGVSAPELSLNTPVSVDAMEYETMVFSFTPEKDGTYSVYSTGEMDVDAYILDPDFQYLGDDYDSGTDYNFSLVSSLEKGKTYYIVCYIYAYNSEGSEYTVNVIETPEATDVTISVDGRPTGYVGDTIYLEAEFLPMYSQSADCFWFSENERVATVTTYESYCEVELVGVGKAEIVVMTAQGFMTSIWVECLAVPEIKLGETKNVSASYEYPAYFTFTPKESGTYVIYSEGSYKTMGALFDGDTEELLISVFGNNADGNFSVQYEMEAGKKYLIGTSLYSSDGYAEDVEGTYTITVTTPVKAEGIEIYELEEGGKMPDRISVGDMAVFGVRFLPETALIEGYTVELSEEGILEIMDLSEIIPNCYAIMGASEGTVTVTVTTESGHTDSFTITVGEADILLGDVDSSGDVSGKDSNVLKQYLTGSYSDINEPNSDINMDGSIDGKDSNILKQMLAGTYEPEY